MMATKKEIAAAAAKKKADAAKKKNEPAVGTELPTGSSGERLFFEQADPYSATGFVGPVAVVKEPTRTPQYDSTGKVIGYLVTTYNIDGSANPATFEAVEAVAPIVPKDTSAGTSAFAIIKTEFEKYGLGSLVDSIKGLIQDNLSPAEMTLALQNTDAYKTRFSANAERIKNGLSALTPAEYVGLEDQYQNVMRNYGLPATYWTKDATGKQAGFDALLSGDVSATELEDRVMTAQERVLNANPEVSKALKQFYGDTITDGDILAYALDPSKALTDIKRKVTAAEIGGAAMQAGLNQGTTPEMYKSYAARAAELAAAGVTQTEAQQNYGTIAQLAQRGSQLADIYGQGPYGQAQAESELFNIQGQTQAAAQRKKLTGLEKAAFSASSGAAQNALSRDRAMQSGTARSSGAGGF
jgi:hypothetical protein